MAFLGYLSSAAIPIIIFAVILAGLLNRCGVYEVFSEGAKEGISTAVRIIPPLVGLMVAIGVFRSSGFLDLVIRLIKPVTSVLGIPPEVMPLALMRPISGSASLAIVADMVNKYGPDSLISRTACTIMGSTETIFYTLAIYFGSVGIKNIRYTLYAALIADFVSLLVSVWLWKFAY